MPRRGRAPFFLTDRQQAVLAWVAVVVVWGFVVAVLVLPFAAPRYVVVLAVIGFFGNLTYLVWRLGRWVVTRGHPDRGTPAKRRARRAAEREQHLREEFDRRHPPTDDPYQLHGPG